MRHMVRPIQHKYSLIYAHAVSITSPADSDLFLNQSFRTCPLPPSFLLYSVKAFSETGSTQATCGVSDGKGECGSRDAHGMRVGVLRCAVNR